MSSSQAGILAPVPSYARFHEFGAVPDADSIPGLRPVAAMGWGDDGVLGLGVAQVAAYRCDRPVSRSFFWCRPVEDGRLDPSAPGR